MSNIDNNIVHVGIESHSDWKENLQARYGPCLVTSCTECCMVHFPDGSYNIRGAIHRSEYKDDCRSCPICTQMPDEEWEAILSDIDGTE